MMVDRSMEAGNVITVIGDGACDSIGIGFIRYLVEMKGIEPIIRPRRDAKMIRYLRIQNLEQNGWIW
jgi:hypothetical protein